MGMMKIVSYFIDILPSTSFTGGMFGITASLISYLVINRLKLSNAVQAATILKNVFFVFFFYFFFFLMFQNAKYEQRMLRNPSAR